MCTYVIIHTLNVSGFDWDDGNLDKRRKHSVSITEIEVIFTQTVMILPDEDHSATEKQVIGKTDTEHHAFAVFDLQERGGKIYIRPISTCYMHQREVQSYEEEKPDIQD